MRLRWTVGAVAALALIPATLTGCGSGGSTGTKADPAGVVPAGAAVYVGAVVRPEGSLKSEALAAGKKLTQRSDPYAPLLGLLQTPGSPKLDYSQDVASWLGPNGAIFFTSLDDSSAAENLIQRVLTGGLTATSASGAWPFGNAASGRSDGALVLDTSDLDKAKSFVSSAASHGGAHATSYRGVSYEATAEGDAFAVVDRFVVLGTEAGVHAVIDTTQGGTPLSGTSSYSRLSSVAPSGALAHVYANPSHPTHAGKAAKKSLSATLTLLSGGSPLNVSVVPSADSVALDADVAGAGESASAQPSQQAGGLVRAAATGQSAYGELPGDAWLAAGLGDLGAATGGSVEGLQSLVSLAHSFGSPPNEAASQSLQVNVSVAGVIEGLTAPLEALLANGAQARQDFLSWMGDAGIFASGTTVLTLKGALAIDSNDPAASRAAVAKLGSALGKTGGEASPTTIPGTEAAREAKVPGLPITLAIADGRDAHGKAKFVIGLSSTSVEEALHPKSTISGSPTSTAAASALGEGIQPSIAVSISSLVSLLEGVGLSEDESVTPLLPALRASTTLSGGGKELGNGIERLRLVLGLQPTAQH